MYESQNLKVDTGIETVRIVDPDGNVVKSGVFVDDRPHRECDRAIDLDFGCALEAARHGKKIWRKKWDCGGTVCLLDWSAPELPRTIRLFVWRDHEEGSLQPWIPSTDDLLSEDWSFA